MLIYIKINDMFISGRISFEPSGKFTAKEQEATKFPYESAAISWIISNIDGYYGILTELDIHRLSSIKIVSNTGIEEDITDFVLKRRFVNNYTKTYGLRTKPLFNDLIFKNVEYKRIIYCKKKKLDNCDVVEIRNILKDFLGSTKNFKIVHGMSDLAIGLKNEGDEGAIRLALDQEYSCRIFIPPTLDEFNEEFEDYKDPLRILK